MFENYYKNINQFIDNTIGKLLIYKLIIKPIKLVGIKGREEMNE